MPSLLGFFPKPTYTSRYYMGNSLWMYNLLRPFLSGIIAGAATRVEEQVGAFGAADGQVVAEVRHEQQLAVVSAPVASGLRRGNTVKCTGRAATLFAASWLSCSATRCRSLVVSHPPGIVEIVLPMRHDRNETERHGFWVTAAPQQGVTQGEESKAEQVEPALMPMMSSAPTNVSVCTRGRRGSGMGKNTLD